jgi:putative glutamine amidotransferase
MFAGSGPRILVTAANEDKAREYCDALREVGADPTVAFAGSDVSLEEFDGLLVTGGGDVDPAMYGGDIVSAEGVDPSRDAFESALLRDVRDRALPTLCICRGLQIANVAFGGTLIPDLPAKFGSDPQVHHQVRDLSGVKRGVLPGHIVDVAAGSALERIVGTHSFATGGRHHQAVDRCADDLHVVASTRDGVVEALEANFSSPFWLAVQWHPESTRDCDAGESRRIFRAFAAASSKGATPADRTTRSSIPTR